MSSALFCSTRPPTRHFSTSTTRSTRLQLVSTTHLQRQQACLSLPGILSVIGATSSAHLATPPNLIVEPKLPCYDSTILSYLTTKVHLSLLLLTYTNITADRDRCTPCLAMSGNCCTACPQSPGTAILNSSFVPNAGTLQLTSTSEYVTANNSGDYALAAIREVASTWE